MKRCTPCQRHAAKDMLLQLRSCGAASVTQEDLVAFYSASAENTASLGFASAAGYRAFARAATIEEERVNHCRRGARRTREGCNLTGSVRAPLVEGKSDIVAEN